MGGYGAIHTALAYPESFSGCIALSSALIIRSLAGGEDNAVNSVTPPEMRRDVFGEASKLLGSDKDPEAQFKKLKAAGKTIALCRSKGKSSLPETPVWRKNESQKDPKSIKYLWDSC